MNCHPDRSVAERRDLRCALGLPNSGVLTQTLKALNTSINHFSPEGTAEFLQPRLSGLPTMIRRILLRHRKHKRLRVRGRRRARRRHRDAVRARLGLLLLRALKRRSAPGEGKHEGEEQQPPDPS
jgi:hypothetical protein